MTHITAGPVFGGQTTLLKPLPEVYKSFLLAGGLSCFSYSVELSGRALAIKEELLGTFPVGKRIWGGPAFSRPEQLVHAEADLLLRSEEYEEDSVRASLFEYGLPVWVMLNGDYLMLDTEEDDDRFPVYYYDHEANDASMISPGFVDFLMAWEKLGYLGPECWLLSSFADRSTGCLDSSSSKARSVTKMLQSI